MRLRIHKPALKLASLYLAILMFISLFFSINLYAVSVQEFNRGLRGPRQVLNGPDGRNLPRQIINELADERNELFKEARERLQLRLIGTNLLILVAGGLLSYYLAIRTLRPIEQSHEKLERFTADASHELKTPITAMQTEIEVALMDKKLSVGSAQKLLKSNLEELAKLTHLTNGLLQLAQSNTQNTITTKQAIGTTITSAIKRVKPAAKQSNIKIKNNIDPAALATFNSDSLLQIISILLDNAIKYSSTGTTVTITTKVEHSKLAISIADQGQGMPAKDLPYIFDRFYRADQSRTKQQVKGYGIGLAIAKQLAKQMNSNLVVNSGLGEGSEFTVTVPT